MATQATRPSPSSSLLSSTSAKEKRAHSLVKTLSSLQLGVSLMGEVSPPHSRTLSSLLWSNSRELTSTRYGASGVWVGTRFVACTEAGAPKIHKELLLSAGYDDTIRTLIFSGRPMSVRKTPYVMEWYAHSLIVVGHHPEFFFREEKRRDEIEKLVAQGLVPNDVELANRPERSAESRRCA